MREDLKRATDSYVSCTNKLERLKQTIDAKGESMPVAKLQKSLDISNDLVKERIRCHNQIMAILPELSEEEYYEWYNNIGPYLGSGGGPSE